MKERNKGPRIYADYAEKPAGFGFGDHFRECLSLERTEAQGSVEEALAETPRRRGKASCIDSGFFRHLIIGNDIFE